ncbi:TOMM precursor leader peptide-binding protein [Streptomyces sp. NPDC048659]|uniref:TOMM precursor leader peptide-binding protein n=1 Tax=Streptomyces sp. NPDC048659 TaxID=3155489 RepID=UPI00341AED0A
MTSGSGAADVRLGFKRHLTVSVLPGEGVCLVSSRGVTVLRGMAAEVLAPLLDGERSYARVLAEACEELPEDVVVPALRELISGGFVRAVGRGGDVAAEAFWDLAGLDGERAGAELAGAGLYMLALAGTDREAAAEACSRSGIRVVDDPERAALTLVLCADYLDPRLAAIDARQRAAARPWLLGAPVGAEPWTGPVFRPGEGPCWHCLAARLRGHRHAELAVQQALGATGPPARAEASLAAGRVLGLSVAVLEAAKWLAGIRHAGQDAVHALDTLTLRGGLHPVARRPQCPQCGVRELVAERVRRPVVLTAQPKSTVAGNGHRVLTPRQMLDRHGHLVDPVTGIVKEIRRDPRGPAFVHSYVSGPNLALAPQSLVGLRAGLRALSGGKGLNPEEARVGALCEAVERYSGSWQGDEPVLRASYRELGSVAVHPAEIQLFDERQHREREVWNAAHSAFHHVPEAFDEDERVDWTPLWSLTQSRQRLVPSSLLYFSAGGDGPRVPRADSNGNAAGGSLEDAVLQGFLELVERDAVALWWYNRTRQPEVDLDAFAASEPWLARLREDYRGIQREVWALDLTTDLGIPVVAALSRRTDKRAEDVLFGFGAHLDPAVALRRAMTEMGQLLPAVADAGPDGSGYALRDGEPHRWWTTETVARQPYLLPGADLPARGPGDRVYVPSTELRDDLDAVVALARKHGLEVLVLDQTRPDIGLPVAKVVVPGLRHFWARFGPGRLYDVPVALGRLERPTAYEDLNPIPLFL